MEEFDSPSARLRFLVFAFFCCCGSASFRLDLSEKTRISCCPRFSLDEDFFGLDFFLLLVAGVMDKRGELKLVAMESFRAFGEMKRLFNENEEDPHVASHVAKLDEDGVQKKEVHVAPELPASSPPTVSSELWKFAESFWKRIGIILTILFTILLSLGINNLVQNIILGFSPNKDPQDLVLLIISQTLYAIVLTIGLLAAIYFAARQEAKRKTELLQGQPK